MVARRQKPMSALWPNESAKIAMSREMRDDSQAAGVISGCNHAFCQEKLIEEKDLIGIRKFAMAAFAGVFTAR